MTEIIITQTVSPKNYCKHERTMCEFANDRGYCVKTGCTKRIIINEVPKVNKNLVEVVRCKDCKHRHLDGMTWNCPFGLPGGEDFFCAYGAKDGDSDDENGSN